MSGFAIGSIARLDADGPRVLIVDGPQDRYLDTWWRVAPIDDRVTEASVDDLLLDAADLVGTPDLELRLLAPELTWVPEPHLVPEAGRLTAAGRATWQRHVLAAHPDERYGTMPLGRESPPTEILTAQAAARRSAEAFDGPSTDDWVMHHPEVLDGAWPRQMVVAPGVWIAVDLTNGPGPVAVIANPEVESAEAFAQHLIAMTPADLRPLKALVAAETRVHARPQGPWALDSALLASSAADQLGATDASVIRRLAQRRAHQALRWIVQLPPRVLAFDRDPAGVIAALVDAIAALGSVADDPEAASRASVWLERCGDLAPAVERTRAGEVPALQGVEMATRVIDAELFERGLVPRRLMRLDTHDGPGEGSFTVSLPLDARMIGRNAERVDDLDAWVEIIDVGDGRQLAAAPLLLERGAGYRLVAELPRTARQAGAIMRATRHPGLVFDADRLLDRAFACAPIDRVVAREALAALARAFQAAPPGDVPSQIRHEIDVDAERLEVAARALAESKGPPTLAGRLLDAATLARGELLRSPAGDDADDAGDAVHALDALLR